MYNFQSEKRCNVLVVDIQMSYAILYIINSYTIM